MAVVVLISAGCGGGGKGVLTQPKTPPPEPPTKEESDLNQDGVVDDSEAGAMQEIYQKALKHWQATHEVEPNEKLVESVGIAGEIATAFLGPIGSTVSTSLLALLGVYARSVNRKRNAELEMLDESDVANRVLVDNIRDLLKTIEMSPTGQDQVAKLKEALRKKQIDAGVYERVKELILGKS